MEKMQKMLSLDQIPGKAALILICGDDIRLWGAGRRYLEFFSPEGGDGETSILKSLPQEERKELLASIEEKAARRQEFSYVRKETVGGQGGRWIHVNAAYLEEAEEGPLYVAVAEDITDRVLAGRQLEEALISLRTAEQALGNFPYLPGNPGNSLQKLENKQNIEKKSDFLGGGVEILR